MLRMELIQKIIPAIFFSLIEKEKISQNIISSSILVTKINPKTLFSLS